MRKKPLGINVLSAARQRIEWTFDSFERICVSFSGGKDSTVMLGLVADEARKRSRKIGLLFVDLEAQYARTIDHVQACLDYYADTIEPYWVALPLNLRNAVSQYEPQWICWQPDRKSSWVRNPPKSAITCERHWDWFRRGMEFEEFVPRFSDWYAQGKPMASFVGIRTQESLNRWRTIRSETKKRYADKPWTTCVADCKNTVNVYPIYDWQTEDIWRWHGKCPERPANKIYDLMYRAGLTIHQARICQPYGDDQRRGLWLFHLLEPATWAKVVARVNGANQGALYAGEKGNILGNDKVTRPDGHTWQSFAELLLSSMPAPTATHYRNKIDVFLQWWCCRGFEQGIPDETDPKMEAARMLPSWRRICKSLLRNDYWCKGLSFSQHKDKSSYARYSAIVNSKRTAGSPMDRWIAECRATGCDVPNRPTSKQLAMLTALTGGTTPEHGWKTLAKQMQCGVRAAKLRATTRDASLAIESIKAINDAMDQSKREFSCKKS